MRVQLLLGFGVVLAAGCGSQKVVPVSGRVTMNGTPLAGATVSFQPIARAGSVEAGIGSTGKTDANGEFSLRTATGEQGAWVGEHRVVITLQTTVKAAEDDGRPRRGGPPQIETIPARYNTRTDLKFEVRPGATSAADFALKSP
jgi:hypothetical protein